MFRLIVAFGIFAAGGAALAAVPVPPPPPLSAASYVLMDYRTGQILAARDADAHRAPASTTKLMTAYVVFQDLAAGHIRLDTPFTVSENAWREIGSRMFIKLGSQVSVNELLQGMLIPSGNDAAMALAEGVAGTEAGFVNMMNADAKKLGLANTHYEDPAGLAGDGQYTSAGDLARLARRIIRDYPQYYHYFGQKDFTWNKIHQTNWNKLLWLDSDADGLKTGYTSDAGYCLVASVKRGNRRMIAVVMGVPGVSKTDNMANYRHLAKVTESLVDYGFRFFQTRKMEDAGKALAKIRVWKGEDKYVEAGLAAPLYVTAALGEFPDMKISTHVDANVKAPVAAKQTVGELTVSADGKTVARAPLVALKPVAKGGIWAWIRDTVLGWF
ncbi:MAG TPA: D-alanyl-D-alanine carboxypeptidase family protein [Gammaproteobacteria bacterium]|nr:D-alanyl-D-alanine carboxypeptidase family protein [Gammaproteobacteria bacterium]